MYGRKYFNCGLPLIVHGVDRLKVCGSAVLPIAPVVNDVGRVTTQILNWLRGPFMERGGRGVTGDDETMIKISFWIYDFVLHLKAMHGCIVTPVFRLSVHYVSTLFEGGEFQYNLVTV